MTFGKPRSTSHQGTLDHRAVGKHADRARYGAGNGRLSLEVDSMMLWLVIGEVFAMIAISAWSHTSHEQVNRLQYPKTCLTAGAVFIVLMWPLGVAWVIMDLVRRHDRECGR